MRPHQISGLCNHRLSTLDKIQLSLSLSSSRPVCVYPSSSISASISDEKKNAVIDREESPREKCKGLVYKD